MDKIVANLQAEEQAQTSDTETPEVETNNEETNNTPGDVVEQPIADAQAPAENNADVGQEPEELDFIAIQQSQVDFARELQNEWYTPEQIQYAQQLYLQELQRQFAESQQQNEVNEQVEPKVDRAQRLQESINNPVQPAQEEKKDEPLSEDEQENYRKLYEAEVAKRIELQWKNSELEALTKYQQNMLDKQGDKQLDIIDKQKEMEIELRRAQSSQTPEEIIPLSQSYQIYQENKTPIHKYRLINQALDLVQKVTWVSAEDYLQQIFLTENKDIPNIEWVAPTAKAPEPEKKLPISF